jgi:Xaa-Pro aminopeptidase
MRYEPISNEVFIKNRKRFSKEMESSSTCIIHSNDEFPRSGDQNFSFKQNPDLFYLTGIDQEETALILCPDARLKTQVEILFLKETNDHIAVWEGEKLTKEKASLISGIPENQIHWIGNLEPMLRELLHYSENIYLNTNENDRYAHSVPYKDLRYIDRIKERYPLHTLKRAAPIFRKLREIKSSLEIELLAKASLITRDAFIRTLSFIKPGKWEFEIEAEITHDFIRNRADGHAYSPIIASGANACVLHYNTNHQQCLDGELILMDFGASYANYNADMTRTVPVNGKFSKRQRAVYDSVQSIFNEARLLLKPGIKLADYRSETDKIALSELRKLGLVSREDAKNQKNSSWRKYYPHGISHYLGLDVHDLGDRLEKIKPGMVFTCEPGIYIREEGIGIRLENDIVITENGNHDLMQNIPMEWQEIEELMNKKPKK